MKGLENSSSGQTLQRVLKAPVRQLASYGRMLRNRLTGKAVRPQAEPNHNTLEFLAKTNCSTIAEIGVEWGSTSEAILRWLNGRGALHLFDFEDRLRIVCERFAAEGFRNFVPHPNSRRVLDSYNWSLMEMLRDCPVPAFDYVYLDGAHTWVIDGFAFCLVDRLLKVGGYIDFDDYDWTINASPSTNPKAFPAIRRLYTDDQMDVAQVKQVVDLLVRRSDRYQEVMPNKIFRKVS
jgi:hypothetical protein